jgi:DNA-binding XRE family transcriptional regulator
MKDSKAFYVQLGENIKRLREEKLRATQESFANRIGLSRPSVANIEKGRQQITVWQLVSFCQALGVELEDLVPGEAISDRPSLSHSQPDSAQPYKEWLDRLQGV